VHLFLCVASVVLAHITHGVNMETTTNTVDRQRALDAGTYDVPDLAALLKCSERHVRNLADAGAIPGMIRFGRLVRFHRGLIHDWLDNSAKGGGRG